MTIALHGPFTFEMRVMLVPTDKNDPRIPEGAVAWANVGMPDGKYPTKEIVDGRVAVALNEIPGMRLATKQEFLDALMLEKTGQHFAMPGDLDWDDPT